MNAYTTIRSASEGQQVSGTATATATTPKTSIFNMENLGYKEGSTKPRRMTRSISVVTKSEAEQPLAENNTNR